MLRKNKLFLTVGIIAFCKRVKYRASFAYSLNECFFEGYCGLEDFMVSNYAILDCGEKALTNVEQAKFSDIFVVQKGFPPQEINQLSFYGNIDLISVSITIE